MENVASREDGDGAQAIIIAAFLVAIGILVLSVLLNGLIFSQNLATRDEGVDERNILEVNQGTQDAVRTAMTGNRTTPADAEDEFDLFTNLYEEELRSRYSGRQAAVSLGPDDANISDLSDSTTVWAIGQKCDLDDSTCRLENATGSPDWNAIENNTGTSDNTGKAFDSPDSPHEFVFTVEQPSSGSFQVDAVEVDGSGGSSFSSTGFSDREVGDWRMTVDDSEIKFERVDSLILPDVVNTNTTTVDWSSVDGNTARIDVLNESINGEDVASIANPSPLSPETTFPNELENDPDKNYLRFWDGNEVEGTYDIRLDEDLSDDDITGPCDAPCSEPGDRGVYAFGVIHEVDGVLANYTDAGTSHTTEIGATLRQEDLILEER